MFNNCKYIFVTLIFNILIFFPPQNVDSFQKHSKRMTNLIFYYELELKHFPLSYLKHCSGCLYERRTPGKAHYYTGPLFLGQIGSGEANRQTGNLSGRSATAQTAHY